MDQLTRSVHFSIKLSAITDDFCNQLQAMAKKAKGTTVVEAQVLDTSTGLTLSMKSQNMRVTPSKFIPWLREMPGVVEVKPVTH